MQNLEVLYSSWVSFFQPSESNVSQTFKRYCFHTMTKTKINQPFSQTVHWSSERRQHYGFRDHVNLSYQQVYSLFWQTVSCSSQQEQHTCPQNLEHVPPLCPSSEKSLMSMGLRSFKKSLLSQPHLASHYFIVKTSTAFPLHILCKSANF